MKKNRVYYAFFLLIVVMANFAVPSYEFIIILIISVLMPLISYTYVKISAASIEITFDKDNDMSVKGDIVRLKVVVHNDLFYPVENINLKIGYKFSNLDEMYYVDKMTRVDNKSYFNEVIEVVMTYSGHVDIDVKESYISDPLGLFIIKLKNNGADSIEVMPILHEPDYLLTSLPTGINETNDYSQHRSGDDSSEIYDMHQYRAGDLFSRVNWKISAKYDELYVKDFGMPVFNSNCIIVNNIMCFDEHTRHFLDGVFEMVYSAGNLACLKEKEFDIIYSDNSENTVVHITDRDDLDAAIVGILRIDGTISNIGELLLECIEKYDAVEYITPILNEEIIDIMDDIDNKNVQIIVIRGEENTENDIQSIGNICNYCSSEKISGILQDLII